MSEIIIHQRGWTAKILESESETPDGFWHVYATIDGDSAQLALKGAEHVLDVYAHGRVAFIRAKPEVGVNRDFDCQITRYVGFVRFSYKFEAGEWHYPDPAIIAPIGEAA